MSIEETAGLATMPTALILLLGLAWWFAYRARKADEAFNGPRTPPGWQAPVPAPAQGEAKALTYWTHPDRWWNADGDLYDVPWWARYPAGLLVGYGAWWAISEWDTKKLIAPWAICTMLSIIALGLMREVILCVIAAAIVGGLLWAAGAAVAALPVSVAIIIGALIVAAAVSKGR